VIVLSLRGEIPLFSKEGLREILRNYLNCEIPLNPPLKKGEKETDNYR
jgi:hypothetical protein